MNDCTPSHAQSIRLKKMSQDGVLNDEQIYAVISEEKPNRQEQIRFKATPHNYRPVGFVGVCVHIFRHIAQIVLDRRQPACVKFMQSDEKSDGASARQ